ncbi:MAG: hypothetical protein A2Y15_05595 [Clostridiales bacterium GWF2_36_10]|nr:MAG: hypothetical protein A2Y15_05595 [Clostridiales bacterium GWF2_36_10]HAN21983.1 hypothetical protein [Clostridiales bacterium]
MRINELLQVIESGTKVKIVKVNDLKEDYLVMTDNMHFKTPPENAEVVNIKNGVDSLVIRVNQI